MSDGSERPPHKHVPKQRGNEEESLEDAQEDKRILLYVTAEVVRYRRCEMLAWISGEQRTVHLEPEDYHQQPTDNERQEREKCSA